MSANSIAGKAKDVKVRISNLWVFVMFNMVFADILSFLKPGGLQAGEAGAIQITQGLLLAFAVLLEIPIAMILLSRVLKRGPNRWANIAAAVITTLFVVGGGSVDAHYIFFAAMEILAMGLIAWTAWKWPEPAE